MQDDMRAADEAHERDATLRVREALDALVAALVDYPAVWAWGDGRGGYVMSWLDEALAAAGLELPARPTRTSVPLKLRRKVMARDGFRCQHCGCNEPSQLTIDHVRPVNLYGSNHMENLQVLCHECNQRKGAW